MPPEAIDRVKKMFPSLTRTNSVDDAPIEIISEGESFLLDSALASADDSVSMTVSASPDILTTSKYLSITLLGAATNSTDIFPPLPGDGRDKTLYCKFTSLF